MFAALSVVTGPVAGSQPVASRQVYPALDGAATESDMDTAVARIHSNMMRAIGGASFKRVRRQRS
jgi:hypothetical protein